jgi:tape measure domain-containing protein
MAINFNINGNNSGFKKAADDTVKSMKEMAREAGNTQTQVNGMFKDMAKQAAAFAGLSVGAAGMKAFASSIVNVRKEMQSLSTSFKVLLGDEAKATAMFGGLKDFAASTPLMLKDLASGAQTMLGFNIEAEKVVPTLKAIGDISMGDAQRFQSLTLAFSQMSATGKLMGQDLLQMINAGFNPLTVMAEKTGKSIAELKDEMSAGAISAQMVADAFMLATSEGGKFYGMLEKQGQDLKGQINQLQGALDDMFNSLGEQSEGVVSSAIGGVTTLVQNYEKVGKILATLIATYGAYKAATVAVSAIEMANAVGIGMTTKSLWESVLATKAGTAAQLAFNTAVKANPYVMLATALVTVVGLLWTFADKTDEAAEAQKRLNDEMDRFSKKQEDEAKIVKDLIAAIQDESSTDAQRLQAYEELSTKCSALTQQYTLEQLAVLDLTKAYKGLNEVQEADRMKFIAEDTNKLVRVYNDLLRVKSGKQKSAGSETQEFIQKNNLAGLGFDNIMKMLKQRITDQRNQYNSWEEAKNNTTPNTTYREDARKAMNDWQSAKITYEKLAKSQTATAKEVAEARSKMETLDKAYETLTGKKASDTVKDMSKDKTRERELKVLDLEKQQAKEAERAAYDREFAIEQARINAMEDGTAKILDQIQLDYEMEKKKIGRMEADLLEERERKAREMWEAQNKVEGATWLSSGAQKKFFDNGGGELTEEDKKYFDALRDAARNKTLNVDDLIEKYQDYSAKKAAIDERYAADRERINQRIKANDEKLAGLGDTEDEKKIRTKIEKEQKALRSSLAQSTVEEARDRMSVAMEELKADPAFLQAFEDLESVSAKTLDNLYNRLVALKPQLEGLDPKNMKVILDLMNNIQNTKIKKDPFKEYKTALQELREAENSGDEDAIIKARKKVERAYASIRESVDELAESIRNLGNVVGGEAGEILSLIGDVMLFTTSSIKGMQSAAEASSRAIQMVERASVILAIISAAIQIFQKLNEVLNKFSSAAKHDELVKKQQDINNLADAVNSYRLEVLKATQAEDDWFGANGLGNLNNLAEQNAVAYENYFEKLNQIQVKYRDKSKNDNNWTNLLGVLGIGTPTFWTSLSGMLDAYGNDSSYTSALNNLRIETQKRKKSFMGIGGRNQKTEDLRSWAKSQFGEDLFDMDGFVNIQLAETIIDSYGDKLQGETKDTLEALVELKKEYEQYQESLRDYVAELYEPLVDNFVDSMWEWFDSGVDALGKFKEKASDVFRDIVSDMMRTIILKNVVAGFQDQVTDLYKQYSEKQIDETSLLRGVAELTGGLMDRYENEIPVIQQMMSQMSDIMSSNGISLKGSGSTTSATVGGASGITVDQANEMNGRMTAIEIQGETAISQRSQILSQSTLAATILNDILDLDAMRNSYLSDIYERLGRMQVQISTQLEAISNNTKKL